MKIFSANADNQKKDISMSVNAFRKKLFSIIISSLILLALITINAKTAYAADSYGIWAGAVEITSDNAGNVTGSGLSGSISYNAASKTLTLNNAKISSGYLYYLNNDEYAGSYKAAGLYSSGKLNVVLKGKNTISPSVTISGSYYYNTLGGINVRDITFSGSGSLTVIADNYGIISNKITVSEGSSVDVKADSGSSSSCTAVEADSIKVNGTLKASSRAVYQPSTAVFSKNISVGKTGVLSAKASSPNTSYEPEAISIKTDGKMTVSGSVSAEASDNGYGISGSYPGANVVITSSGVLTSSGNKQAMESITLSLSSGKLHVFAGDSKSAAEELLLSDLASQKYINIKKIVKAANPAKFNGKTVTIKASELAKKSKNFARKKVITISKAKGAVTYKLSSVNKAKYKNYFKINTKTGKVTVKKSLKAGKYTVKVKVKAAGSTYYKSVTKTVSFKVIVK